MSCEVYLTHVPIDASAYLSQRGDFVMERKELCFPDKFVIWKIDAGKLIQKFDPTTLSDGTIAHKALSTVRYTEMTCTNTSTHYTYVLGHDDY